MNVKDIVSNFKIAGDFIGYNSFGNGHINDTFCLTFKEKEENNLIETKKYILQKVNAIVFPDIKKLMENVVNVTSFLHKKLEREGRDPRRNSITVIDTKDGKSYFVDNEGNSWRVLVLIENTEAYQVAIDLSIFETTGKAFGGFISLLEDFPVDCLHEIIPNFHNTVSRYNDFIVALKDNCCRRRRYCRAEVKFALSQKDKCDKIVTLLAKNLIPTRVTHNDTKINNLLMDAKTNEAVCVIDLDTIMPGSLVYDFGDGIRSGCNTAAEDEKDLSKVSFDIDMFKSFSKGFLQGVGNTITLLEKENLAYGAILITFECGIRFLTDYLKGDVYFKTAYGNHNLVRARTQFKLVAEMAERLDEMNKIINEIII